MKRVSISICSLLLLIMFSLTAVIPISALTGSDHTITKEKEFTSEDKKPEYKGFTSIISENGKEYELTDIQYTNKGTVNSGKTITKSTSLTKTGLNNKSYIVGQMEKISDNGNSYEARITDVIYETNTEGNRWGEVSGSKDYGLQSEKPSVPDTMPINYYDSDTGHTLTVEAHLTDLEQTSSQWQYFSYIDIEVSNYTDSKYMFEGNVINNDGRTVLPESYYSVLLDMAGMNDDKHRISSIYWLGDAYKSGSVKNRQARADIQAYSASYTAHYYERFSLDDITTYNATIKYEYEVPVEDDRPIYKYKATATYTFIEQETEAIVSTADENKPIIPKETVIKTITTLSLLLVLCLGFVILVMFLLTKLRLRKKDFKHRRPNHRR